MAATLNDAARQVLTGGHLAHLITINPDGTPQVTAVWVDLEGDEIVVAHFAETKKVRNIRRDPRVSLSMEAGTRDGVIDHYLVVEGTARVTEGGAPELLARLADRYIGPGTSDGFPAPDSPPGLITRITPTRVRGEGPWSS